MEQDDGSLNLLHQLQRKIRIKSTSLPKHSIMNIHRALHHNHRPKERTVYGHGQ